MWTTFSSPFRGPQRQVVVLGAVEARAHAADPFHQLAAVNGEMTDVISAHQGVRRPVRLELRLGAARAFGVDHVLVGVENVGPRLGVDGAGDLEQRERGQRVVVVQEGHELARRQGQGRGGVASNSLVLRQENDLDALVPPGGLLQDGPDLRRLAAAVRDASSHRP